MSSCKSVLQRRLLQKLAALVVLSLPLHGMACQLERKTCKENFEALVAYRMEAISAAFGGVLDSLPDDIKVEFVDGKSREYAMFSGREGYDQSSHRLIFPKRFLGEKTPNPLRLARHYWSFYEDEQRRAAFPSIEAIDNLLWNTYLQEAARAQGLSWPHEDCSSADPARRLPCEMLVAGITEHVSHLRSPIFNANRLDLVLPDDFTDFRKHLWRDGDRKYLDAKRFGGIFILKPLIQEFGVSRAFAYVAKTPFAVEENNLRNSVLRYQERARAALW